MLEFVVHFLLFLFSSPRFALLVSFLTFRTSPFALQIATHPSHRALVRMASTPHPPVTPRNNQHCNEYNHGPVKLSGGWLGHRGPKSKEPDWHNKDQSCDVDPQAISPKVKFAQRQGIAVESSPGETSFTWSAWPMFSDCCNLT